MVPVFIHFPYFSLKLKIGLDTVLRIQPIVYGYLNIRKSDAVVGVDGPLSYLALSLCSLMKPYWSQ